MHTIKKVILSSFLFLGLFLSSSYLNAENNVKTNNYAVFAHASLLYLSVTGEVKLYKGLSALAGISYLPYLPAGPDRFLSWTTIFLGLRYYLTGEPLKHGLFLQHSLGLSYYLNNWTEVLISRYFNISNSFIIGNRWGIGDHFFMELAGGGSINVLFGKNPNDYGSAHVLTLPLPDLYLGFGASF